MESREPPVACTDRVLIEAALNGAAFGRAPLTPQEAADEGRRAVEAGAAMVHVHARGLQGEQSSEAKWYANFLERFSASCPGVPVSVTSKDTPALLQNVRAWSPSPHVCSVNVGSDVDPWRDLLVILQSRHIAIEAGVADEQMIDTLNSCATRFCHAVVLVNGTERSAVIQRYLTLRERMRGGGFRPRIIAHGYGDATWGAVTAALACGDHPRVGFEDSSTLPNGVEARSNGDLVATAVQLARTLGRRPIEPHELASEFTRTRA